MHNDSIYGTLIAALFLVLVDLRGKFMPVFVHTWLPVILGSLILIFLGYVLLRLILELIRLSQANEFPAFESNWGGLGRGLGGWSVNRTMVIGLVTLLVLVIFGSVSFELLTNAASPNTSAEAADKPNADKKVACPPEEKLKPQAGATNAESTKPSEATTGAVKNQQPAGKE